MVPLFFTIYLARRHISDSRQNRYYVLASYVTLVLLALEVVSYAMENHSSTVPIAIHLLSNAFYFALVPSVGLIILWYLGYSGYETKVKLLLWIPMTINALIAILSIQNGWLFTIDAQNTYVRGHYYFITMSISYAYYAFILLQLFRMRNDTILPSKPLLALVYLLPIVATVLQYCCLSDSYLTSSIATTLLLYYLIVQEAKFDYDLSTKARNRIAFERDLSSAQQKDQEVAFILFDMNNLKQINDTWGHQEGDYLLESLAQLLIKTFSAHGNVYRIGGDEFCVLLERNTAKSLKDLSQSFAHVLKTYNEKLAHPIDVAWGFAETNQEKGISIEDAFTLADKAMYRHKAQQKQYTLR